jgi:hypothetical protein
MWFGLAGALALMVGKILKGVERTSGGEIQAAARAEKAGSAALGAFIYQRGPGDRTRRHVRKVDLLREFYACISK